MSEYLTGTFIPEWLYWQGRLWHRPTARFWEGSLVELTSGPAPEARPVTGLLSPAWVNAHTHLELSHLKGHIPPGRGMLDFIQRMGPQRGTAAPSCIRATLEAAAAAGTWAFVSHQNTPLPPESLPADVQVYPMGEFFGLRPSRRRVQQQSVRRLGYPPTPHSFYALSKGLLRYGRRHTSFPRSVHFGESWEERLWLLEGRGPFRTFFRRFVQHPRAPKWRYWIKQWARKAPALWLVHVTEVPRALLEQLLQTLPNLYAVLCPEANYYLFRRGPDWSFWRRYPTRILLGTDSLANAPSLSVWEPLRRLLLAGFTWEKALQAVVDTPRQWLKVPSYWVQVAPLGLDAQILPETQSRTFRG